MPGKDDEQEGAGDCRVEQLALNISHLNIDDEEKQQQKQQEIRNNQNHEEKEKDFNKKIEITEPKEFVEKPQEKVSNMAIEIRESEELDKGKPKKEPQVIHIDRKKKKALQALKCEEKPKASEGKEKELRSMGPILGVAANSGPAYDEESNSQPTKYRRPVQTGFDFTSGGGYTAYTGGAVPNLNTPTFDVDKLLFPGHMPQYEEAPSPPAQVPADSPDSGVGVSPHRNSEDEDDLAKLFNNNEPPKQPVPDVDWAARNFCETMPELVDLLVNSLATEATTGATMLTSTQQVATTVGYLCATTFPATPPVYAPTGWSQAPRHELQAPIGTQKGIRSPVLTQAPPNLVQTRNLDILPPGQPIMRQDGVGRYFPMDTRIRLPADPWNYHDTLSASEREELVSVQEKIAALSPDDITEVDADGDSVLHTYLINSSGVEQRIPRHTLKLAIYSLLMRLQGMNVLAKFIDKKNKTGQTPLFLSMCVNFPEAVDLLLRFGADPNVRKGAGFDGPAPIHSAVQYGDVRFLCLKRLLDDPRCNGNLTNSDDETPLMIACKKHSQRYQDPETRQPLTVNSTKTVKTLLQGGANPFERATRCGRTALHFAVQSKDLELLNAFRPHLRRRDTQTGLELIKVTNYDKDTVLHTGAGLTSIEDALQLDICRLLLECGADPTAANSSNKKPKDLVAKGKAELINLLKMPKNRQSSRSARQSSTQREPSPPFNFQTQYSPASSSSSYNQGSPRSDSNSPPGGMGYSMLNQPSPLGSQFSSMMPSPNSSSNPSLNHSGDRHSPEYYRDDPTMFAAAMLPCSPSGRFNLPQ